MLDAATYRLRQSLAQQNLDNWRFRGAQSPTTFVGVGFPTQVDSLAELRVISGLMHESRFDRFMGELGGLTEAEFDLLADRLTQYALFAVKSFQDAKVRLPLSSMFAHLVLMKRLTGFRPDFRTLVEVGPGDGHIGFFLKKHLHLEAYWQVEVTESFYLLQHAVGVELFGERYVEHATRSKDSTAPAALPGITEWDRPTIEVPRRELVHHVPWWRLGDVPRESFDIVTSNANLNEMSEAAFKQYVGLFHEWLKPDGALVVHCMGGGALPIDIILSSFINVGFAVVVADIKPRRFGQAGECLHTLENLVLVKEGHPLHSRFKGGEISIPRLDTSIEFVRRMFVRDEPGRRIYSVAEVQAEVERRLAS